MQKKTKLIGLALGLLACGGFITSQLPGLGGLDNIFIATASAADTLPTKAFEAAMGDMMKGMMVAPTGKPDLDLIQGMMPHHQGAIDMSKVVLHYGKDTEIKTLAEGIIKAQENEMVLMKDWLAHTDKSKLPVVSASKEANEQAMTTMMKHMSVPYSGNADVDYVKGMIPHHQGAIDMAKVALKYGKDPIVLKLAQDIVTSQEGEVKFMTDWLKKNSK